MKIEDECKECKMMEENNEERKEAIKELKYLFYTMPIKPPMECDDKDKWKDDNKKLRTALEYAITSLQEKVPIEDAVSRQAATSIPIVPKEERKKFIDYDDAFETGWFEALACVNMLPPVEPKRPKGEWVEVVHKTEQYDREGVKSWAVIFQCPKCGFILNAIEGHTAQYNFCPNCGAEMESEE